MTRNELEIIATRIGVSTYHAAASCCKTRKQLADLWTTLQMELKTKKPITLKVSTTN